MAAAVCARAARACSKSSDETRPACDAPAGDLEIVVGDGERLAGERQPLLRQPGLDIIGGDLGGDRDLHAPRGRRRRLLRRRRRPRCRAGCRRTGRSPRPRRRRAKLGVELPSHRRSGRRRPSAPTVGTSPARAWTTDFARLAQAGGGDGEVEIAGARLARSGGRAADRRSWRHQAASSCGVAGWAAAP